ncbi:NUDIX hydrolase [Magnetospira thiophila]
MPPTPVSAVGVVVWKAARVLLVQRGHWPNAGRWTLPGGHQEWGETIAQAAIREVREETGLEIELCGLVDVVDLIGEDYHFTVTEMAARWHSGTARAASDVAAVIWADSEQQKALNLTQEVQRIIKASQTLLEKASR